MKADLLIEIGTEEIPAGYITPALDHFTRKFSALLADLKIGFGVVESYATPRRLALLIAEVEGMQPDSEKEVTGPPRKVAWDKEGKPTRAAVGFAKTNGVSLDDLRLVETPKGEYVAATVKEKGVPLVEVLADKLPLLVSDIPFPKTMRWEESGFLFARPIRWLVVLHGDEVVPVTIAGVTSSRESRGHRILHPELVAIPSPSRYEAILKEAFVIVSPQERKLLIDEEIQRVTDEVGGKILPDPGLVDQVSFLVEYPHAICGSFDKRYLALPDRVVITAMRSHQRYFSVTDGKGGLFPRFVTIANGTSANENDVRAGNERVLTARLADAEFYWNEDRAISLAERTEMLDRLLWQKGMGSMLDKTHRIEKLVDQIAERSAPDERETAVRAAHLSKADLTTEMIRDGKEFTALQGYMGMEYARESGESEEVCRAIFDQYLPRFSGDELPESVAGALLSLADRIDTTLGCIALGQMPTGSQDPYALRRHARAILRILAEGRTVVPLSELIDMGLASFGSNLKDPARIKKDTIGFLEGRMKNLLTEKGYPYDVVDAVLASGLENPADVERRVGAIRDFREQEEFRSLVLGFKRVVNILKKTEGQSGDVDEGLFQYDEERELFGAVEQMRASFSESLDSNNYRKAMELLISLRGAIDSFFDGVHVMDKDEAVRANRIALLRDIAHLFGNLADLSKVVLEGEG